MNPPAASDTSSSLREQWLRHFAAGRWEHCLELGREAAAIAPQDVGAWCQRLMPALLLHEHEDFRIGLLQARLLHGYPPELAALERVFQSLEPAATPAAAPSAQVCGLIGTLFGAKLGSLITPGYSDAMVRAFFLHEQQLACVWAGRHRLGETLAALAALPKAPVWPAARFLSLCYGVGEDVQCQTALRLAQSWPPRAATRALVPGKQKLRLGFLSARLGSHATMVLMSELLVHFDHSAFEIYAYPYSEHAPFDPAQLALRGADAVRVLARDKAAGAAQIAADEIDVMFIMPDWEMDSAAAYLRPSGVPLVVNFLSFAGSTGGLATHRIVDDGYVPCASQRLGGEALVHFEGSYFCYSQTQMKASSRQAEGLPENALVLAAFHAAYKLSPALLAAWAQILNAVPHSVLWLYVTHALQPARVLRQFEALGIPADRIVLSSQAKHAEHLGRFALADVYLDAFEVSGGTSFLDSLAAGVPPVCLEGERMVQRVGPNLLRELGVRTGLTQSAEEYVTRAIALATNRAELAQYKAQIAQGLKQFAPFDLPRHAKRIEYAVRRIYDNHAAGHPAEDFRVPRG